MTIHTTLFIRCERPENYKKLVKTFLRCYLFGACSYFTLRATIAKARGVMYRTTRGSSGKYIGFGLRVLNRD